MIQPEVIRLFNDGKSDNANLAEEFDSFWKITQTLSEAKQKLEQPLRRALDRANALEKNLKEARAKTAALDTALGKAREQLAAYQAKIEKGQQYDRELIARISFLEQSKTQLEGNISNLQTALNEERQRSERLALSEKRNQELTSTLTQYKTQWTKLLDNDRRMRAMIPQLHQQLKEKMARQQAHFETEKNRLEKQVAQVHAEAKRSLELQESVYHAEKKELETLRKELALAKRELETEQLALKTTSDSLVNYRSRWNSIIAANNELRDQNTRLQQDLTLQKAANEKLGPIQDRELLIKQNQEIRAENKLLRQQIIAKASIEREFTVVQKENEQLLAEFTREGKRFKELADRDHSTRMELWDKLSRAEQEIDQLRKRVTRDN